MEALDGLPVIITPNPLTAMMEIWRESITVYTLPATFLLGLCLVYWLFVILGALDIDAIDFGGGHDVHADLDTGSHGGSGHADLHADGELHADAHADADGGLETGDGWLLSIMKFFNMLDVPVMIFVSVMSLALWFFQVNLNWLLNGNGEALLGFGLLFGSFIGSMFVGKAAALALRPSFKKLNEGEKPIEVIGMEAVVKSAQVDQKYGQIEVDKGGAPLVLNARVAEDSEPISKGTTVIVYREDQDKGIYFVRTV